MPNYTTLQQSVIDFINRDSGSLGTALLTSINNAKMYVQRIIDFEYLKKTVSISLDTTGVGSWVTASEYPVGSPAVTRRVKRIEAAYLSSPSGQSLSPLVPMQIAVKDVARQVRQSTQGTDLETLYPNQRRVYAGDISFVMQGQSVYVWPAQTFSTGYTLVAESVLWEREYESVLSSVSGTATSVVANTLTASAASFVTAGVQVDDFVYNTVTGLRARVTAVATTVLTLDTNIFLATNTYRVDLLHKTDFFLDYGYDFLLYRSLYELNFRLKEDQRVSISAGVVRDALESFLNWNTSLVEGTRDVSLE